MQHITNKTILVLGAHPDDEIIGCGGTIRHLSERNKVVVVTVTTGNTSANSSDKMEETVIQRSIESDKAASILNVDEQISLGYHSQTLNPYDVSLHHDLIRMIRKIHPDIVLTHYDDYHKDHKALHELVPRSVLQASEEIMVEELGDSHMTSMVLFYEILKPLPSFNFIFDITDTFKYKKEALYSQTSQDRKDGFLISLQQMIEGRALEKGAIIQKKYGEAFRLCDDVLCRLFP
ncbi:MAG: PIG-L family deacetylase [Pseudomonadota bacterium]